MSDCEPKNWDFEKKLRRFSISEGIPDSLRTAFKFKMTTKLDILKAEKEADFNLLHEDFQEIEKELKGTAVNPDVVQVIHTTITHSISSFLIVQEKYRELLLKEGKTSEFEEEKKIARKLMRQKVELEQKCHKFLKNVGGGNGGGSPETFRLNLPKRELVTFDGDVRKWLAFWASFKEIHEDPNIPEIEKFNYLVQSCVPNSSAYQHVTSFHLQASNYSKAIESLTERYGRNTMLIKVYVRDLLSLVIEHSKGKSLEFAVLVTKITHQLRNLETLGVTTNECAAILYPVVESCLPDEVLQAWQRHSGHEEKMDKLLAFLQSEVNNQIERNLAQNQFGNKPKKAEVVQEETTHDHKKKTAASLLVGDKRKKVRDPCVFCDKVHGDKCCLKAMDMSLKLREEIVRKKGHCLKCLKKGHFASTCQVKLRCIACKQEHSPIMCPVIQPLPGYEVTEETLKKEQEAVPREFAQAGSSKGAPTVHSLANQVRSPEVPLQIVPVVAYGTNGKRIRVRAVVDPGSQRSYVTTTLAGELELPKKGTEKIINDLFGGKQTEEKVTPICQVMISAVNGDNLTTFNASQVDVILRATDPTARGCWTTDFLRKGVKFEDENSTSASVHVLIGNDIAAKVYTGKIMHLPYGPSAMETMYGWVLCGKLPSKVKTAGTYLISTLITGDRTLADLWNLDTLGILDSTAKESREELEKNALSVFNSTIKMDKKGRYEVELPFYAGTTDALFSNYGIAHRRLQSTTKKIKEQGYLEAYDSVFKQWLQDSMIEECELSPEGRSHYLPHRAVIKASSATTPIRPVFDASARGKGTPSLNDCLEKGPNLLELIPAILIRFRMYEVGLVADIKKAFQQISVSPKHRDYLKFLWWADLTCKKLKAFRHTRVVFGVSSSPFLLGATLQFHLSKVPEPLREVAKLLLDNMYVDNLVVSTGSIEAAQRLQEEAQSLLRPAQFDLRGWEIGKSEEEKPVQVLGLLWNRKEDLLQLDFSSALEKMKDIESEGVTQRRILALCHSLFDPLGIISPFILLGKLIMRSCHTEKLGWDKKVTPEIEKECKNWMIQIPVLSEVQIPRWVHYGKKNATLHVFCDASAAAVGAVAFLRVDGGSEVHINLLMSKSRVAPKNATIPRLELISCVVGARLAISLYTKFPLLVNRTCE